MKARSEILERAKIRQEDEVYERIVTHPFWRKEIEPIWKENLRNPVEIYEKQVKKLVRDGAELKPGGYAQLFQLVEMAATNLQLQGGPRLFKTTKGGVENAFVCSDNRRYTIAFVDGLLNTFDQDSVLMTVIGHEIGHYGYRHWITYLRLMEMMEELFADDGRYRDVVCTDEFDALLSAASLHSQLRELNADRAGLLAMPNLAVALEGQMLLAAGRADRYGRFFPEEILEQARDWLKSVNEGDDDEQWTTHPHRHRRTLAIEGVFQTETFRELTGRGPATLKDEDFDKMLARYMPMHVLKKLDGIGQAKARRTEPREATPDERERAALFVFCTLLVVAADDKLTKAETRFLERSVRPHSLARELLTEFEEMSQAQREKRIEQAIEFGRSLHGKSKGTLFRQLVEAAKVDRKVTDDEIQAIYEIGCRLDAQAQVLRELRGSFGSRANDVLGL